MKKREELGFPTDPETIPLKKDYKVDVEISSAPAYTRQGQREVLNGLIDKMTVLAQQGLVPPEAIKVVVEQFLETFQFGATAEVMQAIDEYGQTGNMEENQINAIKVAVLEVMKDLQGSEMFPDQETRMTEAIVAAIEVYKDTGAGKTQQPQQPEKGPSESISFKDLPPEGKVQMAEKVGLSLSPDQIKKEDKKTVANTAVKSKAN
jgi:hypothetical protein